MVHEAGLDSDWAVFAQQHQRIALMAEAQAVVLDHLSSFQCSAGLDYPCSPAVEEVHGAWIVQSSPLLQRPWRGSARDNSK
jgi:hypothetical protein